MGPAVEVSATTPPSSSSLFPFSSSEVRWQRRGGLKGGLGLERAGWRQARGDNGHRPTRGGWPTRMQAHVREAAWGGDRSRQGKADAGATRC
ncbi:hypothetical protein Taro_001276 [Colocasia esculenta]|uniref:Uncharacterized protein n=1 Tax=Colocasia esculenta TaxID=4460 RepID=A0A843TD19_COLES|nr:hypothetical protein [Colocasia esculenta]